jgi:hypothetical protein
MVKTFYIEVTCAPFEGKLTIDVDAGSEKQAWEKVNDIMSRRICQLKTTNVITWHDQNSEEKNNADD